MEIYEYSVLSFQTHLREKKFVYVSLSSLNIIRIVIQSYDHDAHESDWYFFLLEWNSELFKKIWLRYTAKFDKFVT